MPRKNRSTQGPFIREIILQRDQVESFRAYLFSIPVVRSLGTLPLHPSVTFFVGENGSGKSTLLEAIAVAWRLNAEGGDRRMSHGTWASHSSLSDYLTLVRPPTWAGRSFFLRAESYYNHATAIEHTGFLTEFGGESLHEMSHGESFNAFFMRAMKGAGLYILDEPEAALSPQRQLALLKRLDELVKEGSQFIIATHSPIIMAYPNAMIYGCTLRGIAPIEYRDTDHYRTTKAFLDDRHAFLRHLLAR